MPNPQGSENLKKFVLKIDYLFKKHGLISFRQVQLVTSPTRDSIPHYFAGDPSDPGDPRREKFVDVRCVSCPYS